MSTFANRSPTTTLILCLVAVTTAFGCAPKREYRPVTVPEWDAVTDLRPELPESFSDRDSRRFVEAWASVARGELGAAAQVFDRLKRSHPTSLELSVAQGLIELRTGNTLKAQSLFQAAAADSPGMVAAHGGSFLTALALDDEDGAYRELLAIERSDPSHPLVQKHLMSYQLSMAERHLQTARRSMQERSYQRAVEAYARALDVAPEAGALYLEAAEAALAAEEPRVAVSHATKSAVELDRDSPEALQVLASAYEDDGRLEDAIQALERAERLRPGDVELSARLRRLVSRFERTNLPPEFERIREAEQLTREQLAALLYVSLSDRLEEIDVEDNVLATDINESWADVFIRRTVAKRILEVYPNHTFQPTAYVSRIELANALAMAYRRLRPDEYSRSLASVEARFSDLPPENVNHQAAALSVHLELLGTVEDDAFEPGRLVNGMEASNAVDALAEKLQS